MIEKVICYLPIAKKYKKSKVILQCSAQTSRLMITITGSGSTYKIRMITINLITYLISLLSFRMMMLKYFKKEKKDEIKMKNKENTDYFIIEMDQKYPFGKQWQLLKKQGQVLVRKRIFYSCRQQRVKIIRFVSVLQQLNHKYLVNLHHFEEQQGVVYLYYQYVHLQLEGWILNIGNDYHQILQEQMVELAHYLNQKKIIFILNPKCVGLGINAEIKYFLIDFLSYQGIKKESIPLILTLSLKSISQFFHKLCNDKDEEQTKDMMKKSLIMERQKQQKIKDRETMHCSIATRESWSLAILSNQSNFRSEKNSKINRINQTVEKSKNKTKQVLEKLRKSKIFSFQ